MEGHLGRKIVGMKYRVDNFRIKGVNGMSMYVTECDCGNDKLRHTKESYIFCPQCDAVYTPMPVKSNLPEAELDYVKTLAERE